MKTTSANLIRFAEVNMNVLTLDETLQCAITAPHTAYFKVGGKVP